MNTSPGLLFVDLDGTLVRTDTSWELFLSMVRSSPERIPGFLSSLLRGRARAKEYLAHHARIQTELLPLHPEFLHYLQVRKREGTILILATGAHESVASRIALETGMFDKVLASTGERNLTGTQKLAAIHEEARGRPFAYAGNSLADLPILRAAADPIVVAPSIALAACPLPASRIFFRGPERIRAVFRSVRPHQWAKNLLIFGPILASHSWLNGAAWGSSLLAFLAFSLLASAMYLLNDLFDLEQDRLHSDKRNRPLADGSLSIPFALGTAGGLMAVSGAICLLLPPMAGVYLGVYAAGSMIYSGFLRRLPFLDVSVLACFYTLRVMVGGAATGIIVTAWLWAAIFCLSYSLTCLKRYIELSRNHRMPGIATRPGYQPDDLPIILNSGMGASLLVVLLLAIYSQEKSVQQLYRHPQWLLLACPAMLYWINRIWLKARRGEVDTDPVKFCLTDPASYVIIALVLAIALLARY